MSSSKKFLLIGDNHPEMIAVAKAMAEKKYSFKILLPVFFHNEELKIMRRVPKFGIFANKRLIPQEINRSMVKRPLIIFDLLVCFFVVVKQNKRFTYFSKITESLRQLYIKIYLLTLKPDVVIVYDTFFIKKGNYRLIVIAPTVHPNAQNKSLKNLIESIGEWPERVEDLKSAANLVTISIADRIIVLSKVAEKTFINNGINSQRIKRIPIGPKHSLVNGDPVSKTLNVYSLVFLGRITLLKGIQDLLDLSHRLTNEFEIHLIGNCSDVMANYVSARGNSQVLQLHRNKNTHEISRIIQKSSIMIHPSYCDGFSISCIEGMRSGLIPLFSNRSGVSEILTGTQLERFIFEPGDVERMLSSINLLKRQEKHVLQSLSATSKELSANYSFNKFAEEFLDSISD